jgi:transcriptional regulator with XRE-family HTH domain
MMPEAVMQSTISDFRETVNSAIPICDIDFMWGAVQASAMLTTADIIERLDAKGIRNRQVAQLLGVQDSRVTEIRQGTRRLQLEEAVKLVQAFELEPDSQAIPLPVPILRLVIRYIAIQLGVPQERVLSRLEELTEDLRAFSEFVADPKVRRSLDAAEGFFRAMEIRRPPAESEAPQESDRARAQ